MTVLSTWIKAHPRLTAWLVLALGMNAMLIYEARSVGLLAQVVELVPVCHLALPSTAGAGPPRTVKTAGFPGASAANRHHHIRVSEIIANNMLWQKCIVETMLNFRSAANNASRK